MGVYPGTSMAIRGNKKLWIVWVLISSTELVYGYSACSSEANAASIPAALLCYDNQVSGNRVVIDGYRAKESSTAKCECTVTSNEIGKFNISNYNGNHPGTSCGTTLLFQVGGDSLLMNCFVTATALSIDGSGATVSLENLPLAQSTDYCISIESDSSSAVLNVSCGGDPLPSTSTTQIPLTTKEIETSSSSLTTSGHPIVTETSSQPSSTTEDISTPSTTAASGKFSTSAQSSATTNETVAYSHPSTVLPSSSPTALTSSEASSRTEQITSPISSTAVSSSSTSQSTLSSSDVTLISTSSTMTSTIGQTTESDTTTDDMFSASTDSTTVTVTLQTPEKGTTTGALSTTSTDTSMQTMTTASTASSTSTQTPTTSGDQNALTVSSTTSRTNTENVSVPRPQADRGTQWSLIIPGMLLGIILFFALLLAFIKWKRSREIKYPKPEDEDYAPLHYKNSGGHTNIGYNAYDEGPEIITEFTKSPEIYELDSIVLDDTTENEPEPQNLTEGAFIRYDVKDYRRSRNSLDTPSVKREQNGPDVYF